MHYGLLSAPIQSYSGIYLHIVGPKLEFFIRHLHVSDYGLETVVDVHHGQSGVRLQKADVFAFGQGVMEDLYCVICLFKALIMFCLNFFLELFY